MMRLGRLVLGLLLLTSLMACGGGDGASPATSATPTQASILGGEKLLGIWYVIEKEDLLKAVQEEVAAAGSSATVEMGTMLYMPAKDPTALYWCKIKQQKNDTEGCVKIKNVLTERGL
jgi:hypothetical protein